MVGMHQCAFQGIRKAALFANDFGDSHKLSQPWDKQATRVKRIPHRDQWRYPKLACRLNEIKWKQERWRMNQIQYLAHAILCCAPLLYWVNQHILCEWTKAKRSISFHRGESGFLWHHHLSARALSPKKDRETDRGCTGAQKHARNSFDVDHGTCMSSHGFRHSYKICFVHK